MWCKRIKYQLIIEKNFLLLLSMILKIKIKNFNFKSTFNYNLTNK